MSKIAITGASGLLGRQLANSLESAGHSVVPISRSKTRPNTRYWSPIDGVADEGIFEDIDAIVHLSGENIAAGMWTEKQKAEILGSRVRTTQFLCSLISQTKNKPSALLCASGIGYYGNRGDEKLTEESSIGTGFLAEVCKQWESCAKEAERDGLRVVSARLGMVLSAQGGALQKMLPAFRLGLGGPIGSGTQYMSWISIEDASRAFMHLLEDENISGPVNLCSPEPVKNQDFSQQLARQLSRPCIMRVPAFAIKLVLGKMGEALLLASNRAFPEKLVDSGFTFTHRDLNSALEAVLSTE